MHSRSQVAPSSTSSSYPASGFDNGEDHRHHRTIGSHQSPDLKSLSGVVKHIPQAAEADRGNGGDVESNIPVVRVSSLPLRLANTTQVAQ